MNTFRITKHFALIALISATALSVRAQEDGADSAAPAVSKPELNRRDAGSVYGGLRIGLSWMRGNSHVRF